MIARRALLALIPGCICLMAAASAATYRQALSTSPDWTLVETFSSAGLGRYLSDAGDVNGDGFDDVLIGAPGRHNGTGSGRFSLYPGSASGLASTPSWFWEGSFPLDLLDQAEALGDFNGDGFGDIIVAASVHGQFGSSSLSWVFLGSSTGLSATPSWIGGGRSVAGVGDVNADGFDDLMVGGPGTDRRPRRFDTYEGSAALYLGSSNPDTRADQRFRGSVEQGNFGFVAGAGDVDGDGFDDVLIGAPGIFGDQTLGVVYLYTGSNGGLKPNPVADLVIPGDSVGFLHGRAGDVNADGFDDFFIVSGSQTIAPKIHLYMGAADLRDIAPSFVLQTGGTVFASAGDVNDDGFGDVIAGLPQQDRAFVYLGSASGLSPTPVTLEGVAGEFFGSSVSAAQDVNGDGFDDVLVGAPRYAPGGRALAYHGGP